MTAVNGGVHHGELTGVRLPLQPYTGGHAVFMYSTAADGNVTLQLKEPDDMDRSSLAAMLARLHDDATFSISYQDTDMLSDGIDVLLGSGTANAGGNEAVTATFDLFDSSSGPDLTLSPQTFTNSAEAFINDNSNSLGVPTDNDAVSTTTDDKKISVTSASEIVKLTVKRARPKAASPNRQGPQQCQVCSKVFGNASALAKHKLTHSDERKYVCTMCGKAFKRQDHLNGHMLTHRNKKPYECKADGCGKSYCDARSLRRHTENHHSGTTTTSTSTNTHHQPSSSSTPSPRSASSTMSPGSQTAAVTTLSPAQGAASGDAASPHGSSCIQYAPAPTSTTSGTSGKSQLQQLLATEPAKGSSGGSNDGLTKQQLDLIHQIMEQTQRQSQTVNKTIATVKPTTKVVTKTTPKVQRSWSSPTQQTLSNKSSANSTSTQQKVTTTTPAPNKPEPKPVECNLCHRKFKNIPALNGHMRLHGGYFKKDADNKKCEKKDVNAPPLQTASVSVRALIEEKIISKRTTNTQLAKAAPPPPDDPKTKAPPLFPLTVHSTANTNDLDKKITSFVVPTPPQQQQSNEKSRRHSDAEVFTTRTPSTTQQEAEALADLILKRENVMVKRTTSDPGQRSPQIIQFQPDSFTLSGVDGYLSPTLQNEVFTQVPDTMLLQGVDAQQLASIQFQADSLLQDQSDIALDDYTSLQDASPSYQSSHSVNQELQAVLDSPLPEGLAEFSTFHSTTGLSLSSPGYQTQSPAQYSGSITAQSPLQSPLIRHDSPGFAYPTPPASHEGQSPCFGQNNLMNMVSPKNDFGQIQERGLDEPPQASSPLSAAFFTSTMSSSEAVEEALEEVLPGETIAPDDLYPLSNSPTPQSPIGLTPVQSPIPHITSTTTIGSHASTTFTPSANTVSFPMSPHYSLQSQMLPNSDDPLLSSSPKDFPKKKFEFNGVPLRLISNNGVLDLNNSNFAGILVDNNGELKFIQTGSSAFQAKNILVANTSLLQGNSDDKSVQRMHKILKTIHCSIPTKQILARPRQIIDLKREENNDVFLSPTMIPASPVRLSRKRPRSEPLQLPILHQSKLRATRSKPQGSVSFTPQPILNPQRQGSGLYTNIKIKEEDVSSNDSIPESDSTPHINIGSQFQCDVSPFHPASSRSYRDRKYEDLLWDPGITKCTNTEVEMYLEFACCAAVPGAGRNKEYAMHLLHMCSGNIHEAMLKLMQPSPNLPAEHPLLSYQYTESDKWTAQETDSFHRALLKHDKDFNSIAQEIGTKSIKQCIQFYYIWKKVCADEYRRLKLAKDRRFNNSKLSDVDFDEKLIPDAKLLGIVDSGSPMPIPDARSFICEYSDCSASFNSRAALNGHIRIHGGSARNSPTPSGHQINEKKVLQSPLCHPDSTEDYPCKICGKVFTKIKSRSAHMKSHRPPDAEPIKRRDKESISSNSNYDISVPSLHSS